MNHSAPKPRRCLAARTSTSELLCRGLLAALFATTISALLAVQSASAQDPRPPAQANTEPAGSGGGLRVEAETVTRGQYRLVGEGELELAAADALAILTAFDEHCAEGCRWPISSLDQVEILEGQGAEPAGDVRLFTWTRVDDVMDASYFQAASYRRDTDATELVIETPDEAEIARLEQGRRKHAPFFHRQRTAWKLVETPGGSIRIRVEMEMSSDRFLVNLMPKRVLEGAKESLREYFAHLEAAAHSSE